VGIYGPLAAKQSKKCSSAYGQGGQEMIADEVRKEGFEIFKKGLVRRLSSNHFVAKTASAVGWQIVEINRANGSATAELATNGAFIYTRRTCILQHQRFNQNRLTNPI
jgi:hypothetical protein